MFAGPVCRAHRQGPLYSLTNSTKRRQSPHYFWSRRRWDGQPDDGLKRTAVLTEHWHGHSWPPVSRGTAEWCMRIRVQSKAKTAHICKVVPGAPFTRVSAFTHFHECVKRIQRPFGLATVDRIHTFVLLWKQPLQWGLEDKTCPCRSAGIQRFQNDLLIHARQSPATEPDTSSDKTAEVLISLSIFAREWTTSASNHHPFPPLFF